MGRRVSFTRVRPPPDPWVSERPRVCAPRGGYRGPPLSPSLLNPIPHPQFTYKFYYVYGSVATFSISIRCFLEESSFSRMGWTTTVTIFKILLYRTLSVRVLVNTTNTSTKCVMKLCSHIKIDSVVYS